MVVEVRTKGAAAVVHADRDRALVRRRLRPYSIPSDAAAQPASGSVGCACCIRAAVLGLVVSKGLHKS